MTKLEPWADSPYLGNRSARWEELGNDGARVIFGTLKLAPVSDAMRRTTRPPRQAMNEVIAKAKRGAE